jgi:hypothetical protein
MTLRWTAPLSIALALCACTLGSDSAGADKPTASFTQCTPDPRIACEAGSEALALRLYPLMADALGEVQRVHSAPFTQPVRVTTYASVESFQAHSGGAAYAQGMLAHGAIHFSPSLLGTEGRTRGVLVHELSHLNLYQQLGPLAWGRLPSWFHEGLATAVAHGGGAETYSDVDALYSMASGQCFVPEETQWILFPKNGSSYGLNPHMFYRQAGMFVAYLRQSDPQAFGRLLAAVQARQDFSKAVMVGYNESLQLQWHRFLLHSQGAFAQASERKIGGMCRRSA